MFEAQNSRWMLEYFSPQEAHLHGIKQFYVSKQTPFQTIDIAETYEYGKCLFLDGKMQSSFKDEYIYHELLIHPAMITHPNPKKAFIVGGGEGSALREILKYNTIESAVMVDIDKEVVELSRQYLPEWHQGAFDDPRTVLLYEDARKYLENTEDKYDLIVIDITEPVKGGPSYLLFTKEFYHIVMDCLTEDGIISLQAASTNIVNNLCHVSIYRTIKEVFPVVRPFQIIVPSFDAVWGIIIASKKYDPAELKKDSVDKEVKSRNIRNLRHYDGITHEGLFYLPKDLREVYKNSGEVIRDNQPFFLPV